MLKERISGVLLHPTSLPGKYGIGSLGKEDRKCVLDYLNTTGKTIHWDFIRLAWASVAATAIVPMQDLLGLGTEARMNLPGTTVNNWRWRLKSGQLTDDLANRLAKMTKIYGRDPKRIKK